MKPGGGGGRPAAAAWRRGLLALLLPLAGPAPAAGAAVDPSAAVTRTVQLLEELRGRIEADGKEESGAYDKYACWCETATSQKAESITAVRAEMQSLGNKVLQLKGSVASLISEVKVMSEDMVKNERQQQEATAVRQEESAVFHAEKVELEQAIQALHMALTVLREGTASASLLRRGNTTAAKITLALSQLNTAAARLPKEKRPDTKRLAVLGTVAATAAAQRYAPQSLTVQGILGEMYDTFTSNLQTQTRHEATAHRNYEDLMSTWQSELLELQETVEQKEQEKAEKEMMLADATQGYADSETQLGADVAFFDATKASCETKTEEWSERKALRDEELAGISQALGILTSDSAREVFSNLSQPEATSLLQESASSDCAPLAKARAELQARARQSHSIRLAALAANLGGSGKAGTAGHFPEAVAAIDTLLATLKAQEAEDARKAAKCKEDYKGIASEMQKLSWKVEASEAGLQKLEKAEKAESAEKAEAEAELASVRADINQTREAREAEVARYQQEKAETEQAVELLRQAKAALAQFYANHSMDLGLESGLLQRNATNATAVPDAPVPDAPTFSHAGTRKLESRGILGILTIIMDELKLQANRSAKAQETGQLDYEKRMSAAETLAEELGKKITDLQEAISLKDEEILALETAKGETTTELENQNSTKEALKPECDWIISHIAERRNKRAVEAEGLTNAKEFLQGARLPAMVQERGAPRALGGGALGSPRGFASLSFLQRRP